MLKAEGGLFSLNERVPQESSITITIICPLRPPSTNVCRCLLTLCISVLQWLGDRPSQKVSKFHQCGYWDLRARGKGGMVDLGWSVVSQGNRPTTPFFYERPHACFQFFRYGHGLCRNPAADCWGWDMCGGLARIISLLIFPTQNFNVMANSCYRWELVPISGYTWSHSTVADGRFAKEQHEALVREVWKGREGKDWIMSAQ